MTQSGQVEILRRLAAQTTRSDKEQVLIDTWMMGERDFFRGVKLCYDPLTIAPAKVALIDEEDDGAASTYNWYHFATLARNLQTGALTEDELRLSIWTAAERANITEWNEWYRRILRKDLNCGITVRMVNKVLGKLASSDQTARDHMIPTQVYQRSVKLRSPRQIRGARLVDQRTGGIRVIAIINPPSESVRLVKGEGRVAILEHQALAEKLIALGKNLPMGMVFDGELHDDRFAIFDLIELNAFCNGRWDQPQWDRHEALVALQTTGMLQACCERSVYVLPKLAVDLDTPEGRRALDECLAAAPHGITVKDPLVHYERTNTSAWLTVTKSS